MLGKPLNLFEHRFFKCFPTRVVSWCPHRSPPPPPCGGLQCPHRSTHNSWCPHRPPTILRAHNAPMNLDGDDDYDDDDGDDGNDYDGDDIDVSICG